MTKRVFLELVSGLVAWPAFSPLTAWAAGAKLKNWAGNLEYGTEMLHAVRSLDEVREFVRKQAKLKVLGTRHCFNTIADSSHAFLSLGEMDDVLALDPAALTVTVAAGLRYGQLCPYLHEKGFALHNLASLPHISIAGACSTATHGSGEKNGNLASAVRALDLVTAAGEVVRLSADEDGEAFRGAVVGLGALGVVTKVTLAIQPTFAMRQWVYEDLPLAQMKDHFDAIQASAYSVSLFTDWQQQKLREVWIKSRTEEGQTFAAPLEFFGAKRATKNLHPIAELGAENCTEQLGVPGPWFERLPHFRMGFTPSAGKELAVGVLRAPLPRGRGHSRARKDARSDHAPPDDHGDPHDRRGPPLDEPLLPAGLRRDPLHVEAGLAGREPAAAIDREGARPLRRPAALGEALHDVAVRAAIALRAAA